MKKYFTLLVLSVLTCMSGSRALAQTKSYPSQTFTEEMDFTGFNVSWDSSNRSEIVWAAGSNYIAGFTQSGLERSFASELEGIYYLSAGQDNDDNSSRDGKKHWAIGQIDWDANQNKPDNSYLQRSNGNDAPNGAYLYIHNLKKGDKVKIWLVKDQNDSYACQMASSNTTIGQGTTLSGTVEFEMTDNTVNEGRVTLLFDFQYTGVQKIQITTTKPYYNYDPGYEVYDFFEIGKSNNVYTGYTATENAGFTLHGNPAKYLKLNNDAGLSLNNRIAVCQTSGWTIKRGIRAPGYPTDGHTGNAWHNVSICNLYAGDRVEIFYTGVAPKFSSNGENGGYNGSNAFKDVKNDGEYNPDEEGLWKDQMIYSGMPLEGISSRNEGNLSQEENSTVLLYKSFTYVMTEDGHLDLGLWNGGYTRILKIKIYSDHQATMIDESVEGTRGTRAFFDITGELQAKEHIVPGGLEVRVGNEVETQHAIVVESRRGPVSYVNAVDGFKLPGITGSVEEGIQFQFDLENNLPTTGTFYKFIALNSGKLKVRFNASSVNYYSYRIPGDAVYFDDGEGDQGPWLAEFNRSNEWTYDLSCPYYVMVSTNEGPEGADAVWDPSSSGSGSSGGGEGDITLTNGNNYILELSQLSSFSDDDIVTFHITRENSYINNVGGLSDRNSYQASYSFPVPTTGEGQTLDFDCTRTVGDIRALANNTGGVRVILQSVTSVTITLPSSSGSGSGSSGSGSGLSSGIDISGPKASSKTYGNGADGEFALYVEAGKTYYFYGGWTGSPSASSYTTSPRNTNPYACGVAQLLDVTFEPDRDIHPLAKWVPSKTPAVDDEHDAHVGGYLADIIGYRSDEMTVKKMSGNIETCEPFIENNKLKIRNITYKEGENPGGVILIKFGTYNYDTEEVVYTKDDPVYALTVAYDANYHSETPTYTDEVRGHTWDFSTSTLQGLEWDLTKAVPVPTKNSDDEDEIEDIYENISTQNYAVVKDYGISTDQNSLLYKELDYTENGVKRSDWLFNYRVQSGSNNYDPRFLNKYDIEGDNADMIWTSEGLVFKTSANQSCMYNEYVNSNDNTGKNTINRTVNNGVAVQQTDPDRYVGILSGGEFIIPWLKANDRVIIYMGSGTDAGVEPEVLKFKITNALDALHNEISENDVYVAGGSLWNASNGDPYYRGCYHFFAKADGDMKFTLDGTNSVCKLYKIQIYRGDRINTNEIKGATASDKFLLVSTDVDPNDASSTASTDNTYPANWTLKYFGKDQQLANGVKGNTVQTSLKAQDNEIIAKTGKYDSNKPALTDNHEDPEDNTSKVVSFTYQHQLGEIGTFRVRGKDMEKNMNYVADYADHNVTVAYQQTQLYPYTWDFKDMTGWGGNTNNGNKAKMFNPEDAIQPDPTDVPDWFKDRDEWEDSYEFTSQDLSLWETYSGQGTYYLRLNSQTEQTITNPKEKDNIFQTATQNYDGNQLWANGQVVPETQGLWFYTDDNFNHSDWYISDTGMEFRTKSHKLVVPNVPAGAAVYLRMEATQNTHPITWTWNTECEVYGNAPQKVGDTSDYIFAIKNDASAKRHLTISLAGYRMKKMSVSTDAKRIAQSGYATESRANDIDHELTAYLTGLPIKAYTAKLSDDKTKVVLTPFGTTETGVKILPDATSANSKGGCILYHEGFVTTNGNKDHTVSILGGGFHEFVPDMHDKVDGSLKVTTTDNIIIPFMPARDLENNENIYAVKNNYLSAIDGTNTNLILSTKKYSYGTNGASIENNGYEAFFVRVDPNGNPDNEGTARGAKMWKCTGYIQLPTTSMVPLSGSGSGTGTNTGGNTGGNAKLSVVFADDFFEDIVTPGIATDINNAADQIINKGEWYSLDGRKLNGAPNEKGLYIVNGKKVLVK